MTFKIIIDFYRTKQKIKLGTVSSTRATPNNVFLIFLYTRILFLSTNQKILFFLLSKF